jgi:hypothetical protein
MRTSTYILDVVAEKESTMMIKHVKYGQHVINVNASEETYSFVDNSTLTLHTFKISVTSPVLIKNFRMLHDTRQNSITIYEANINGISLNQEFDRIKKEAKNQTECYIELSKIPFSPINLKSDDLLVLRFTTEWFNFDSFDTDLKNILRTAKINRK